MAPGQRVAKSRMCEISAPRQCVDRLVVVSDHAQAPVVAGERREDPLLDAAGVLVFVDEQVIEAAGLGPPRVFVVREEFVHEEQQVVEVDRASRAQRVLVAAIARRGERPAVVGVGGNRVDRVVGTDRPALPPAHAVEQIGRPEHRVGHLQFLEHRAGRRLLLAPVDDGEPLGVAEPGRMAAEDPHAERVDRGDLGLLDGALFHARGGPGQHLAGGLVGERDREDSRRAGAAPDEVRDPCDHHAGLSGAGSREHEQRCGRREHRLRLRGVEAGRMAGRARPRPRRGGAAAGAASRTVGSGACVDDGDGGTGDMVRNLPHAPGRAGRRPTSGSA